MLHLKFWMDSAKMAVDVRCATKKSDAKKVFRCVPKQLLRYG